MRFTLAPVFTLVLVPAAAVGQDPAARPNIVVIMADDMGFSDIGCYGGEIKTPNLDSLAAGGVRFTQFYNTGRCCPTRASLLTGLYPHQAGVGHMMSDRGHDGYRGELNRECVTIAEVLRTAGYATFMSGKWHVTTTKVGKTPADRANWPRQRGFDRYFGTIDGAGSFWTPNSLTYDNEQPEGFPADFYYTDAISDHAAGFVRDHVAKRKAPFFLYVAYTAPHWPLHARPRDIAKYDGVYEQGWDAIRAARHRRMIDTGLVQEKWPCTTRDGKAKPWSEVPAARRAEMVRRMQIYAAQIDSLDQGVGRLVKTLRDTGQLDNTLVLFLADNGGCAEGGIWGFERHKGGVLGTDSSFASYGLSWANASNTPFREYKHWVHEGGISTPLIAHWPKGIEARGGWRHQPGHLIDLMATCVDLAGATYPQTFGGKKIQAMAGRSLRPAFAGRPIQRDAIYWEHEGNRAVRVGDHKLVAKGARGAWELYDLATDRTELRDLSRAQPERVRELAARWQAWAARSRVLPLNPRRRERLKFSKQRRFVLAAGADLARTKAPDVRGQRLAIRVAFDGSRGDGVLVAQGGSSAGYAVYLQGGRLCFATRHGGRLNVVRSGALPDGAVTVQVTLARRGRVRMLLGSEVIGAGKVPGAVGVMPIDGLQVGRDAKGAVGGYQAPFAFGGKIESVIIELGAK